MADTAARLEAPGATLTERDREVLAFERHWWKYAGAKEQAIKELFDMSATRYYQVLNGLLDNPAALEADPLLASLNVVKDNRVVWLEATDELTQAFSAASPLSIPIAAKGITERLAGILAG